MTGELGVFDGIIIHAACYNRPYSILEALKKGGSAVFPMGPALQQQIALYSFQDYRNDDSMNDMEFFDYCNLKSIRGKFGWVDQVEGYFVDEVDA